MKAVCRVCGGSITPKERAEVRDYCKNDKCVYLAAPPLQVVAVPTHKSTPMFMRTDGYSPGDHLDNRRNR